MATLIDNPFWRHLLELKYFFFDSTLFLLFTVPIWNLNRKEKEVIYLFIYSFDVSLSIHIYLYVYAIVYRLFFLLYFFIVKGMSYID